MGKIVISGESDDLIRIEGDIDDEHSCYTDDESNYLGVSDGTLLSINYTNEGMWRINRVKVGLATYQKVEATDPDSDYSDKVTLEGDISWIMSGKAMSPAKKMKLGGAPS